MPVLKNPRHERFAQGVAKGKSAGDAYLYAGYEPGDEDKDTRSRAAVINKRVDVQDRIEELLKRQAKRVGITIDALLAELQEMYLLAKRTKQASAGIGAVLGKAKLLGLVTDKVEVDGTIRKPASAPTEKTSMSLDEWRDKFAPKSGERLQ